MAQAMETIGSEEEIATGVEKSIISKSGVWEKERRRIVIWIEMVGRYKLKRPNGEELEI